MLERLARPCRAAARACYKAATMARRILKWAAIVAGSALLIPLLLLLVAWVVNARADEPLTAQTRELLEAQPGECRPEDNIYLAIEGFDAPPGASVVLTGQARIEHYNQRVDAVLRDPSPAQLASLRAPDARRLQFSGDLSFLHPLDGSVWDEAEQHRAQIERLLADNAELYQRYLALIGLRAYCETARPSWLAPLPMAPAEVRKLFLGAIALHLRSAFVRERELALADLESDVQLWRAVLTAHGALLAKMLAVDYLQSDSLLLADLIADGRVALPPGGRDAQPVAPLFELRDWDIGGAFAAEFRVVALVLRRSEDPAAGAWGRGAEVRGGRRGWLQRTASRLTGHFFKLNATLNLIARQTAQRMLAASDPARFHARNGEPHGSPPLAESLWSLPVTYNPVGKVLAAVAAPAYDDYPLRAWDAAAVQRMVRASYAIRERRLTAAEIPAFLAAHPELATHPADGRRFLLDAATLGLRVPTLAQHPAGRRFSIRLWRP